MGQGNASPMLAVKRTRRVPDYQPKGTVATSLSEVDEIIRRESDKIYKENAEDGESARWTTWKSTRSSFTRGKKQ